MAVKAGALTPAHPDEQLAHQGPLLIILGGFLMPFVAFFVFQVFLASDKMQFFEYVLAIKPIGVDLRQVLVSAEALLAGGIPYDLTLNLYPPLAYVFFRPLLLFPAALRFQVMTWVSMAAYVVIGFAFPLGMSGRRRVTPALTLVFVTGLLSYGLQFELERGQFNVVAVMCSLLAVWIFHKRPSWRWLAYALFSLSVQLKLYPFIFILTLVDDWRDYRTNIRRLGLLAVANSLLLLALGPRMFVEFVGAVRAQSTNPMWIWRGDHSIYGFLMSLTRRTPELAPWVGALTAALSIGVLLCLGFIVVQGFYRRRSGASPSLLLACSVAALLLPSISTDYKLSTLAGPAAVMFCALEDIHDRSEGRAGVRLARSLVVFLLSVAYSTTLLSYAYKPPIVVLQNMFPALTLILLCSVVLSVWQEAEQNPAPPTEMGS